MLFARQVRGPLAFLKDHWEEPKICLSSVLSYLLETRERLIDCIDLLKKINIRKAPTESVFRSESKEKTIWVIWHSFCIVAIKYIQITCTMERTIWDHRESQLTTELGWWKRTKTQCFKSTCWKKIWSWGQMRRKLA